MSTSTHNQEMNRRESFRVDMQKELVDIVWADGQGVERQKEIMCIDFSCGGLKVGCDQSIELKTPATVIFKAASPNSQKLYGRVIRCIKQNNDYFEIALRIDEDIKTLTGNTPNLR